MDYKFERDSYKFVAVLACIAGVGFINSIFTKVGGLKIAHTTFCNANIKKMSPLNVRVFSYAMEKLFETLLLTHWT